MNQKPNIPKSSTVSALISHFGGQKKTAEALDVAQPTVSGWLTGVHGMSPIVAIRAEKKTGGLFKAADLCPRLSEVVA